MFKCFSCILFNSYNPYHLIKYYSQHNTLNNSCTQFLFLTPMYLFDYNRYENLNSWGETLIAETKKLAHALIATKPQIKALTVKKLLKICKYTCQATTILLVAVKSVAAFDAENENVQKKV